MKIKFPERITPIFEITYLVRVDDINYGNHMGNERYLLVAQETRSQYFRSIGFSEHDLGNDTAIVVANAFVNYKKEVFYGEQLIVQLGVSEISRSSFDFVFQIFRDEILVATVLTTTVCIGKNSRRPVSIPQNFLRQITEV